MAMKTGLGKWGYPSPHFLSVHGGQRLNRDELRCQYSGQGEAEGGGNDPEEERGPPT